MRRILTFTSLYPSEARPRHGIFVETRLAAIQRIADVEACVVSPVPWFPFEHARFGTYAKYACTSRAEVRLGNRVFYPRYWTAPGVGMYVQPLTMALGAAATLRKLVDTGFEFDVIDAHYLYPDGVAAAILARKLDKPLVITARGSDVNLLASYAWPRRLLRWAASEANAIVTVSAALSKRLIELGVDACKITVARNGVDMERFAPVDQAAARQRLGLETAGTIIASIGNLVIEKGHDVVIDALRQLPTVRLIVVGDGPERARLLDRVATNGLTARVLLLSAQPQHELKWIYGAADVVVLASMREGLPNVLLEAIACGRPVVATRVGGIPEIVTDPVAGRMIDERTPTAVANAVKEVLAAPNGATVTSAFARRFEWPAAARSSLDALERGIGAHARRPSEVNALS